MFPGVLTFAGALAPIGVPALLSAPCFASMASVSRVEDAPLPDDQPAFLAWDPANRDLKVQKWQYFTQKMPKEKVLSYDLKEYFNPKQMTWLWASLQRKELKSERKDGPVMNYFQGKGDDNGGEPKTVRKNTILKLNLGMPCAWRELVVSMSERLGYSAEQTVEEELFTRGELEQMKGFDEADRHIREGRFEEVWDDDLEEYVYKRVRRVESEAIKHSREIEGKRQRRVTSDEYDQLREGLLAHVRGAGNGLEDILSFP